MKLSDHQFEFMKDLAVLIDYIANVKKYKITGGWLERNKAIQKILVDAGLSKTMDSNHLKRLAIDFNLFIKNIVLTNKRKKDLTPEEWDILSELGVFWENLNKYNRWGGFFNSIYDPGHFERNIN